MVQVNSLGQRFDPNGSERHLGQWPGGSAIKSTLAESLSKKVVSEHHSTEKYIIL